MAPKHNIKVGFPLWQFLDQPLFSPTYRVILNPQRFWQLYRIQLLERCWAKNHESEGYRRNW